MNRLRLSNGEFPPLRHYGNFPLAFVQAVLRKAFGVYPRQPWIPFAAIKRLAQILDKNSRVWEVGSGNSTLWLADRVAHVVSIEADERWFKKLSGILQSEHATHVDLRYLWHGHEMADFSQAVDIDLAIIDGGPRHACLINALDAVKPGGWIYCDNVNVDEFYDGNFQVLIGRFASRISSVEYFIDYAPATASLGKGALLRKRAL